MNDEVPGFSSLGNVRDFSSTKCEKSAKKCGGFQAMGLSSIVLKAIRLKGYRIPTPIQRRTIPLLLEGRDIVGMAKTGSGKTACFLIPLFEKFKRTVLKGPRVLILSPTRELAVQTYKFSKEIGKFSDLKVILVLGGDSMDSQFSALHASPDVIIATPGRFLHVCVEMDLTLSSIEYVVFDEADRLFEMGFGEQLKQILSRLPSERQTVMFSATMPKLLIDFVEAGLRNPVLTRLDVESKLPETLDLKFIYCRPVERYAALLILLKYMISKDSQVIVFAATQHHIEVISALLTHFNISNTCIYSNMDASARKINAAKFGIKKVTVLIVTDIAARGIDIPNLDCVINFHFPGKSKLFLHRVGRCARAGKSGTAYTIFSTEDVAHVLDLHLFLNQVFDLQNSKSIGKFSQDLLEDEHCSIMDYLKTHIMTLYNVSENAYKKYISSRPVASVESNRKVKTISFATLRPIEGFYDSKVQSEDNKTTTNKNSDDAIDGEITRNKILSQMKSYRPSGTIFELNPHKKSVPLEVMKQKRAFQSTIINNRYDTEIHFIRSIQNPEPDIFSSDFNKKIRDNNLDSLTVQHKKKKNDVRDPDHYVPYESVDKYTEEGLSIQSFARQARKLEMSLVDRSETIAFRPGMKKWDRIKKKMVSVQNPRAGKIQTESGLWIPATYKTGRYAEWKQKTKVEAQQSHGGEGNLFSFSKQSYPINRYQRHINTKNNKLMQNELKPPEQIAKKRLRVEIAKQRELQNKVKKQERKGKARK